MSQKILAHHCLQETHDDGLIEVTVDQVVLAKDPNRVLATAVVDGLARCIPEVNIAYPPNCLSLGPADDPRAAHRVPREALSLGFLIAQPGAGFASSIHLERFASPGRLMLTDEPRMSNCGAVGMLTLPASKSQISCALRTGKTQIRPPRSIQILLSGRLRPFVCIRDVSLELLRRNLKEAVQKVDRQNQAPVFLEFGGTSAKQLSVSERAVLCSLAPQLGAAGCLFSSDEKTEASLRDQRRSKAYRVLHPDAGAPWEDVFSIELSDVEPLLMDESGQIHPVRDLSGKPVEQVLLGGDSGLCLRDWLASAALLRSKRVSTGVDFLLCPSSRQILEILARSAALADLISTGARLIEPDRRIVTGELYAPSRDCIGLKTSDHDGVPRGVVASSETLSFAVAHGEIGDPRHFKRPVRVTVPRNLPTEDVLLIRGADARGGAKGKGRVDKRSSESPEEAPKSDHFGIPISKSEWRTPVDLKVTQDPEDDEEAPCALIILSLNDVQRIADDALAHPQWRALFAPHIPSALVSILADLGVLSLRADANTLARLGGAKVLKIPDCTTWQGESLSITADDMLISVDWLGNAVERKRMSES